MKEEESQSKGYNRELAQYDTKKRFSKMRNRGSLLGNLLAKGKQKRSKNGRQINK